MQTENKQSLVTAKTETPSEASGKHKQERFWQILFPFLLSALLAVGSMVWIVTSAGGSTERIAQFGQAAAILVVIPWLLVFLINLAVLLGFAFGVYKLRGYVPKLTGSLLGWIKTGQGYIEKGANYLVEPFITGKKIAAQANQYLNSFKNRFIKG